MVKEKITSWLKSIALIKDNITGLEKSLPKICKNGVIFFDLINHI